MASSGGMPHAGHVKQKGEVNNARSLSGLDTCICLWTEYSDLWMNCCVSHPGNHLHIHFYHFQGCRCPSSTTPPRFKHSCKPLSGCGLTAGHPFQDNKHAFVDWKQCMESFWIWLILLLLQPQIIAFSYFKLDCKYKKLQVATAI